MPKLSNINVDYSPKYLNYAEIVRRGTEEFLDLGVSPEELLQ